MVERVSARIAVSQTWPFADSVDQPMIPALRQCFEDLANYGGAGRADKHLDSRQSFRQASGPPAGTVPHLTPESPCACRRVDSARIALIAWARRAEKQIRRYCTYDAGPVARCPIHGSPINRQIPASNNNCYQRSLPPRSHPSGNSRNDRQTTLSRRAQGCAPLPFSCFRPIRASGVFLSKISAS